MKRAIRATLPILLMALAMALGAGCFFEGPSSNKDGGTWDDFPNPKMNQCGDITPAQMGRADTLVFAAGPKLEVEANFFLSDSVARWTQVARRDLPGLQSRYAGALAAAPNHCGALFGHALTTALSVVSDKRLDSLVREADEAGDFGGMAGIAQVPPDGAAPALFKLRRGMAATEKSLITLAREVGETVLLPRLDTAIAELERVSANPDFRFDLGYSGRPRRLDRGEVAPLLGGLKVLKAALFVIVGYQWQAEADETYPHARVLKAIKEADLDSLTAEQVAALDHYTGLAKQGSAFTRIRTGWEERIASIPTLLLESVGHAQAGLAYGLEQAEKNLDQSRDPYTVGTGENADVDPADIRKAIDHLERTRKYLRGEVAVSYNKGADTLRVDFPKLFRINGLQGLLPHFAFHPYPEWNDTVVSEFGTRALGPVYFTNAAGVKTLEGYELEHYSEDLSLLTDRVQFPDPTFGGIFPGLTNQNIWPTLKSLTSQGFQPKSDCGGGVESPCDGTLPDNPSDLDILDYYLGGLGL